MNMHEAGTQDLFTNRQQSRRKDKFVLNQISNAKEKNDPSIIRRMITKRNMKRNAEQITTLNANATLNMTIANDSQIAKQRVLSPVDLRRPVLSGIEQIQKARETSLVNKLLRNVQTRVNSPKVNEAPRTNDTSPFVNDTSSHITNMKKLRLQRNLINSNSKQRTNNSTSTTSSPSK